MKTVALTSSILTLFSVSVIAEDLADIISQEKTYTVRLSDGQIYYGVEFREWRSETDWGHISYGRHRNASSSSRNRPLPQGLEIRPNPGVAWINFNQVTSIHEVEPSEESADETSDTFEAKAVTPDVNTPGVDIEADEGLDESRQAEVQWFSEEPVGFGEGSDPVVVIGVVGAESEEDPSQSGLEAAAVGGLVGGEVGGSIGFVNAFDSYEGGEAAGALVGALIGGDAASERPGEEMAVINRLNAITSICERVVEHQDSLFAEGRASQLNIAESRIALLESQIDLAEAKAESDKVAKLLRHLIEIQRGRVKFAEKQFAAGESDETEIAEAEIALLRTEIRFLRLEK